MSKIELPKSPVVFEEDPHGYWLEGKRLSGVTGLIHAILKLGVYPGANDFVRQVAIPRAGAYGSAVHKSIELYDEIGIKQTKHPEVEYQTENHGVQVFGPFDVSQELDTYIKHREGFEPIANEYTVSDNSQIASNIDNVWRAIVTQGIWLVDTKTNNLDYYPGGVDGLKLYLSWQLSIYAYLFEKQTGLKVEGLAANWLRHSDGAFWIIERQPDDFVEALLNNTVIEYNGVSWQYEWTGDADMLKIMQGNNLPAVKQDNGIVAQQTIDMIAHTLRQAKYIEEAMEAFKKELKAKMIENGIKSFNCDAFSVTLSKNSIVTSFNSKKFKEDHPDLYSEYSSESRRAGSLTIKLKDK
ncbi:MAG: hypothetical protein IKZ92_05610 [Muribaculaceae bacterium]|nr:hypothetical protein [Muribaculaceae bacterium]